MNIVDILNSYDEVKDNLEFQSMSNVRTKIIINLSEGPKNVKELQKSIGIARSIILHGINELEKENLVLSGGNYYYLSKIGKETASKLIDMIKVRIVLQNNRELWLNHEIESIPYHLLMEIGNLSNSELMEIENDDLSKTHRIHANAVLTAGKVKGVSPIFYSDYINIFNTILNKGVNVELILTEDILKKTIKSYDSKSLGEFIGLISKKQLKIWKLNEDVKVAFTVTDKAITLGLFSKKGLYDSTRLLVSDHKNAIEWCNKLFDYYLKRAQKVGLEYFEDLY